MPHPKETPGRIVTSYAFNYSVKFAEFADAKYPELKAFPPDARHAAHQAAIVVGVLVLMERRTNGDGSKELHDDVVRSYPPSAKHRCLTSVQDLLAYLTKVERGSIAGNSIPSVKSVAALDDKQLSAATGQWLAGVIMDKWTLGAAHQPIAAFMSRSAWTSSIMIVKMLQRL